MAHSRAEINSTLLEPFEEVESQQLVPEFFMYRFKTLWCPIGTQHDWQKCHYAHNYQDARRDPNMGYGPRPCPHWDKKQTVTDYESRCPHGLLCPYSHGSKEQLYHPAFFKTVVCIDHRHRRCPRGYMCAFTHNKNEARGQVNMDGEREPQPMMRTPENDGYNYDQPLPATAYASLQSDFRLPPFVWLHEPTGKSRYPASEVSTEIGTPRRMTNDSTLFSPNSGQSSSPFWTDGKCCPAPPSVLSRSSKEFVPRCQPCYSPFYEEDEQGDGVSRNLDAAFVECVDETGLVDQESQMCYMDGTYPVDPEMYTDAMDDIVYYDQTHGWQLSPQYNYDEDYYQDLAAQQTIYMEPSTELALTTPTASTQLALTKSDTQLSLASTTSLQLVASSQMAKLATQPPKTTPMYDAPAFYPSTYKPAQTIPRNPWSNSDPLREVAIVPTKAVNAQPTALPFYGYKHGDKENDFLYYDDGALWFNDADSWGDRVEADVGNLITEVTEYEDSENPNPEHLYDAEMLLAMVPTKNGFIHYADKHFGDIMMARQRSISF